MRARVLLEAAGPGWIVHPAGSPAPAKARALLESVPAEDHVVPVAVAPEVDLTVDRVLSAVAARLRRDAGVGSRHQGVRLLVPHSATGPEPTAARLSTRLDAPVHAPEGPLWIAVDGSLFAGPSTAGESGGRWWRFTPSGSPQASGPRHPSPPWQSDPEFPWSSAATEIPAGWWLSGRDRPVPPEPEDMAFDLLPSPDRSLLLLGGPDGEVAEAKAIVDHLAALPVEHRGTCLLTGYDIRQPVARLAREAAAHLGEPVRYTGGSPLLADDGTEHLLLLDGDNLIPYGFAAVLEALPDGALRVVTSRPPVHGWPSQADHVWPLTGEFMLEVIPSGLWLRPDDVSPDRAWLVHRQPGDARTVMVTVETGVRPDSMVTPAVGAHLVARLPAAHRDRVRFAGPGTAAWPASTTHDL